MAGGWYAHSGEGSRELLCSVAGRLGGGSEVLFEGTPEGLRNRLRDLPAGTASVVVGPSRGEVDPINLAAAIVHDGHARDVVLVVDVASGSLRSRASRAGVSRVLDRVEAEQVVRAVRGDTVQAGQPAGPRAARTAATPLRGPDACDEAADLDEPSCVEDDSRHLREGRGRDGGGPTPGHAEGRAPVVVVASGRGGVGKSAIVATMACAAASWGLRVSVVDLDLCSGNLYGYFGLPKAPALDRLADGRRPDGGRTSGLGVQACEGVTLWGPCARPEMAEAVSPHVRDVLLAAGARSDLVLVDTSTTWTDAVAEAVQGCDRLLLVGDERAGAIASMTRAAALSVRLGVARTRIARVTNRQDPRRREDPFLFRADIGLETARAFPVLEGGDEVAELLSAGQAPELVAGSGDFASSVATMLAKLLEELGALPDDRRARAARDREVGKRSHGLFSRMREAS